MTEYVCIYASGMIVRDIAKTLVEKGLAVRADLIESFPMYLKNNKVKMRNSNSVLLLVERARLDETLSIMQSLNRCGEPMMVCALPVLTTIGI